MTILSNDGRMRPILIIPPGEMSPADIQRLNDNGICTVEAKNPAAVKFLDPIPSMADRTQAENAAIQLGRKLLNGEIFQYDSTNSSGSKNTIARFDILRLFVDGLVKGTGLDSNPTPAEQERKIFDAAKRDELQRLAREEAKAERQAKQDSQKKPTPIAGKSALDTHRAAVVKHILEKGPTAKSDLCRACQIPGGSSTAVFSHVWFETKDGLLHLSAQGLAEQKG